MVRGQGHNETQYSRRRSVTEEKFYLAKAEFYVKKVTFVPTLQAMTTDAEKRKMLE